MPQSPTQSFWKKTIPQSTNPLRFLLAVSQPHYTWAIFSIIAVILISTILAITAPYVLKYIVDAGSILTHDGSYQSLTLAAFIYIGITLGSSLLWRISGFLGMHWMVRARATARFVLTSYITIHSHEYFSNRFAGSLSSKISAAANGVSDLIEYILWVFLNSIVYMIASFVITFLVNPTIGFIFLGWVIIIIPINFFLAQYRMPFSRAVQQAETELMGTTVDILTNITAVHEYSRTFFELERFKLFITKRYSNGIKNGTFGELVIFINNILQVLFISGIILTVITLAHKGLISSGNIVLILTVIILMEGKIIFIGQWFNSFSEKLATIKESLTDILVDYDVTDKPDAKNLIVSNGAITFDHPSFSYEGVSVFKNLHLAIAAGEKVGLVGRSGAGKSTLVKLLLRHYDLTHGHILIDGQDIATINKESLRQSIAIVPQEPMLFHRTIRENIAYGKEGATNEEIGKIAELAQAHEFITTLRDGYDSLVGERGIKLSGGQRQRIVIARALLKDAPILLLDEATSSLDSENELLVQKALFALMKGRTVIAIAHRLSTLRAMDRIVVLDKGEIIESGTHDHLITLNGLYASLWNQQAGSFLGDT